MLTSGLSISMCYLNLSVNIMRKDSLVSRMNYLAFIEVIALAINAKFGQLLHM